MRIALRLPVHNPQIGPEFADGIAITELAQAAEAAGFDAIFVTDHPIPCPDFERVAGHHSLDPFVTLAFVAGVTSRLRLLTFLAVLPYRNPFITAKAVATLDVLSGGRVILGAGAGYMKDEYAALGVDYAERNDLADEAIAVMKQVWTGEPIFHQGLHFLADGNVALPVPTQRPHPPIWIGGNSRRAIRRAVELADGWIPNPVSSPSYAEKIHTAPICDLVDLKKRIDMAREHAAAFERSAPLDIGFMALGTETYSTMAPSARLVEGAAEIAALGVTYVITQLSTTGRSEMLENIERLGQEALPEIARLTPTDPI